MSMFPLVAQHLTAPTSIKKTPVATPAATKPSTGSVTKANGMVDGSAPMKNRLRDAPPATRGERTSSSITPNSNAIMIFSKASGFDP
mmetsp:Transcript_4229/g.9444  ORF Transcript_4229/g.9444 Transcript_4229/m.9444 type:complete len:87 (-) Transcript_4229:816-1076(-)